jgi:hypothetical protein
VNGEYAARMSEATSGNERNQTPDFASLIRATFAEAVVRRPHPEERAVARVSKDDETDTVVSWFETAQERLLTMRDFYFPYSSRILAWIFAMPDIQRS